MGKINLYNQNKQISLQKLINMKTEVNAIEFQDIRGKKQKYVVIGDKLDPTKSVVINVGQKTFDLVKNLTEPEQPKLPLNEKGGTTKEKG